MKRNFTFTRDYTPGTADANGNLRTGQELMRIVPYKGRLFASTSVFTDPGLYMNDPAYTGCQVLRKDDSKSEWQVDISFGTRYLRTDTLQVVRFTRDANGKLLPQPVEILVAGIWDLGETGQSAVSGRNRKITLAVRDDITGNWIISQGPGVADTERGFASVRAIFVHLDRVTGMEYLFVGAACGGLHKCVYDPSVPGSLRWLPGDELTKSYGRVHSFCVCNGDLYVSCDYGGLTVQNQSGGVYLRKDGQNPVWVNVYRNYDPKYPTWNQTGRGITAVPADDGSGKEVILIGIEYPPEPVIVRIEPHHDHRAVVEINYRQYLKDNVFGGRTPQIIGGSAQYPNAGAEIAAVNYFDTFIEPETGRKQQFVTLVVAHPDDPAEGCNNAYFLIRRGPGIYDWGEIDSGLPLGENLRGVRTIAKSPFTDEPDTYYFGGYFAGPDVQPPRANLCWIYKGTAGNRVKGTTKKSPLAPIVTVRYQSQAYEFSFAYPREFSQKENPPLLFMATGVNQSPPWLIVNTVDTKEVKNAVSQTFAAAFGSPDLRGYSESNIYLNAAGGIAGNLVPGGIIGKKYRFKYQTSDSSVVSVVGYGWGKGNSVITIAVSYWGDYTEAMANYLLNKIIASTTYK